MFSKPSFFLSLSIRVFLYLDGCIVYTFLINVLSANFYVALFRDTPPFQYWDIS